METFKKWAKNALIVLGVLFILAVAYALVSPDEPEPVYRPTPTVSPHRSDRLSKEFEDGYMEGCTEEGVGEVYCQCTLDYLNVHYTNDEIIDMSIDYYDTDELPSEMIGAIKECLEYLEF